MTLLCCTGACSARDLHELVCSGSAHLEMWKGLQWCMSTDLIWSTFWVLYSALSNSPFTWLQPCNSCPWALLSSLTQIMATSPFFVRRSWPVEWLQGEGFNLVFRLSYKLFQKRALCSRLFQAAGSARGDLWAQKEVFAEIISEWSAVYWSWGSLYGCFSWINRPQEKHGFHCL